MVHGSCLFVDHGRSSGGGGERNGGGIGGYSGGSRHAPGAVDASRGSSSHIAASCLGIWAFYR